MVCWQVKLKKDKLLITAVPCLSLNRQNEGGGGKKWEESYVQEGCEPLALLVSRVSRSTDPSSIQNCSSIVCLLIMLMDCKQNDFIVVSQWYFASFLTESAF